VQSLPAIVLDRHVEEATFAREPVTVTRYADGRATRVLGGANVRGGITFVTTKPFWTTVTPQGTWPASALPVSLYVALPRSRDLGANEDAEIDVAARAWGDLPCCAFRAIVSGTTTTGPGDDGTSGVYFEDDVWPSELTPGAIATTVVHVDAQGNIYDADVYVNGADHVFSLDGHGATVDFRSIATHEIGHVLGLGESADPIATMYTSYPPGVSWRSLEADDRLGACTLYPGTGSVAGCVSDPCPTDFVCVARTCERDGDQRMTCSPCEPSQSNGCEGAGNSARCVALDEGYACARPCAPGDDCGPNFSCIATTEAGDYECVATNGCASAANPCVDASACADPGDAGFICAGGACLGPIADAGADADAQPDAMNADDEPIARGGCDCDAATRAPHAPPLLFSLLLLFALAVRKKRA
jgi:hypothetical protein